MLIAAAVLRSHRVVFPPTFHATFFHSYFHISSSMKTMTTKAHELCYFDTAGRAEPIRVMLHAAGIAFKDARFTFEDWTTVVKRTTPLGAVPTLKIGDVTYCQSLVRFHI